MEIHWAWNFKEKKSKEHYHTFRSVVTYFKTRQMSFEEGNHHAIKWKINTKSVGLWNYWWRQNWNLRNSLSFCWITVTILKNEQGFILKGQHSLRASFRPKSKSGPNNTFSHSILTPKLVFLLHVSSSKHWIPMSLLKCIVFLQASENSSRGSLSMPKKLVWIGMCVPAENWKWFIMSNISILINMFKMDQRYNWAYTVCTCRK